MPAQAWDSSLESTGYTQRRFIMLLLYAGHWAGSWGRGIATCTGCHRRKSHRNTNQPGGKQIPGNFGEPHAPFLTPTPTCPALTFLSCFLILILCAARWVLVHGALGFGLVGGSESTYVANLDTSGPNLPTFLGVSLFFFSWSETF